MRAMQGGADSSGEGAGPAALDLTRAADCVGLTAVSRWIDVTAEAIARFADATGDDQWIHVDADRARRESPYGDAIAHGFLTLALASVLMRDGVRVVPEPRLTINCALNRVRFESPVPAGARVRGRFRLVRVEPLEGAIQAVWSVAVEREASAVPCCAAEWTLRYCL